MRILWRLLLMILIALFVMWLIRAAAFRSLVHHKILGQRAPVPALTLPIAEPDGLEQAMAAALDSTAARLHFSTGR